MIVKLLTEYHLEFLSLKEGCRGSSESTLVKMSNCWKSHAVAHLFYRYGIHLKVIHTTSDATERLSHLIRQAIFYLRQQQKTVDSGLRILFLIKALPDNMQSCATICPQAKGQ